MTPTRICLAVAGLVALVAVGVVLTSPCALKDCNHP